MKKLISCALLAMAMSSIATGASAAAAKAPAQAKPTAKGYSIKLNVSNKEMRDKPVMLAFYFNGKTYSKDTAIVNNRGIGELVGDKPLEQGIYIVYFDANKFFDLLVGEDQTMELKIDTAHIDKVQVSGAKESEGFQSLINFMSEKKKVQHQLTDQYKNKKLDSVTYNKKLDDLASEVETMQKQIIATNKGLWLSEFVQGTIPIEIPEMKEEPDSTRNYKRYLYRREHYFDNVKLNDPRFLRSPYFPGMVDSYMKNMVMQHPDTLYEEACKLIEASRTNKETLQTMCSKMLNYGLTSQQMGMDGMWSRLAQKYYLGKNPLATWSDSSWLADLKKEVKKVKYNLIGMDAKDLRMRTAEGYPCNLSDYWTKPDKNRFVLAYFFEPSCGHCRKTTPVLHDSVYAKYHKAGFEVFAVYTQTDKKEWQDFIEKDKLSDWVNVWDPDRESYFWEFYDATVTPGIYLIECKEDGSHKIVAKKIDMPTLGLILEEELINIPARKANISREEYLKKKGLKLADFPDTAPKQEEAMLKAKQEKEKKKEKKD